MRNKIVTALLVVIAFQLRWEPEVSANRMSGRTITTEGGAVYTIWYPVDSEGVPPEIQKRLWWRNEKWTGSERPYVGRREEIEAALKGHVSLDSMEKGVEKELVKKPWDSEVVFSWAYIKWLKQKQSRSRKQAIMLLQPVASRLSETKFPKTYEYARLAFLVQNFLSPTIYAAPLGDRLLRNNADDEEVRFRMIRILIGGTSQQKYRAVRILSTFQKKYPKIAYYDREYAILMRYLYFAEPSSQLKKVRASVAIAAFEKYQRETSNKVDKKEAKAFIDDIEENLKLYD